MPDATFEFDASDLFRGMRAGGQVALDAARKGLTDALLDLERRAQQAAPVDQSVLMGGIHARVDEIVVTESEISGVVATGAESSDYAIVQHEDVLHHVHPTEGTYASKYLERPIKEMAATYAKSLADAIRSALGS